MDKGLYEGQVINVKNIILNAVEKNKAIDTYRKIAEKGAITCPFCSEKLLLRAGDIRDIHLAHSRGRTCQIAKAYDRYQVQVARENTKHSVIKEIIYTDLKGQERFKPDLRVNYGYEEKGTESWRHYPDIYLNKNGREFAISIITNVHEIGDNKVVRLIDARNKYFKEKGLETIWFIEDRELAMDYEKRILHLWEAEYGLAIKTEEDHKWDELLNGLVDEFPNVNMANLFGYRSHGPFDVDVRSLYYVHSEGEHITISTHRIILDHKKTPYRAFAITKGYQQSISYALIVKNEILLSDPEQEEKDRLDFANEVIHKIEERRSRLQFEEEWKLSSDPEQAEKDRLDFTDEVIHSTDERKNCSQLENEWKLPGEEVAATVAGNEIDFTDLLIKVRKRIITAGEARQLYYYVKQNKEDLIDYGLTLKDLSKIIDESIGRIEDPKLREWLVGIQFL